MSLCFLQFAQFASGNVGIIRVWDINKELPIQDIPTNSEMPVTALVTLSQFFLFFCIQI
jgi:hypothetical protein